MAKEIVVSQIYSPKLCRKFVGEEYPQFENVDPKILQFTVAYALNDFKDELGLVKRIWPENDREENQELSKALLVNQVVLDLLKVVVQKLIEQKKSVLESKTVNMLYAQAFYDPAKIINAEGEPVFESLDDLEPELRCCIEKIETKYFGKFCEQKVSTVIMVDRQKALDKLGKYLSMYNREDDDKGLKIIDRSINNHLHNILLVQNNVPPPADKK